MIIIGEEERLVRDAKIRIAADAKALDKIPKTVLVPHIMECVGMLAMKDNSTVPIVLRALANTFEKLRSKQDDIGCASDSDVGSKDTDGGATSA